MHARKERITRRLAFHEWGLGRLEDLCYVPQSPTPRVNCIETLFSLSLTSSDIDDVRGMVLHWYSFVFFVAVVTTTFTALTTTTIATTTATTTTPFVLVVVTSKSAIYRRSFCFCVVIINTPSHPYPSLPHYHHHHLLPYQCRRHHHYHLFVVAVCVVSVLITCEDRPIAMPEQLPRKTG